MRWGFRDSVSRGPIIHGMTEVDQPTLFNLGGGSSPIDILPRLLEG